MENDEKNRPGRDRPGEGRPATFKIRIDKTDYEPSNPTPTGGDLLVLAGKNPPERFQIFQRGHGGQLTEIKLTQTVDLRQPGVERFVTLPLDQTEGERPMDPPRRDFGLPGSDASALERSGRRWETRRDGGAAAVLIYDYPIPAGYNTTRADILLKIEPSYPETQIDMVYVAPALSRSDGKPIGGLSAATMFGRQWQQWSRHRTGQNPWRPGIDDIATHLALVDSWFRREIAA